MNKSVFRIFSPPVFPNDEDKTRIAAILNTILLGTIALLGLLTVMQGFIGAKTYLSQTTGVLAALVIVSAGLLVLMRRGYIRTAGFLFVAMGWILLTIQAWTYSGLRDATFIAYVVVIVMAALLSGARASLGFAAISVVAGWVFAYLETTGKFNGYGDAPYPTAIAMTVIFLLVTLVSYLAINNLNISLKKARQSAEELKASNLELQTLHTELEKRVADRTVELSTALELNQKRASQLKTIADVAHQVSMVQDIEELLPTITRLIAERFGFYHVGIFLLNEDRTYAVLKAVNSEGGQRMLKRGHKLQVGQTGIVGFVTSTGRARVAKNVGVDAIHFNNPDLPDTQAEMALPLIVGNQVIGALDIQSQSETEIGEENLDVMRTLADQVAIAIETARLIGETRLALSQSQEVYRRYIQQGWSRLASEKREIGYRGGSEGIHPLSKAVNRTEVRAALETGNVSTAQGQTSALAIPIKLRDEVIGVLDISAANPTRRWTSDDRALLQAVADRIALAMENARLIDETSRRANRERTVSDITTKIRSTTDPQSMLQTALEELKQVLGIDNITVKSYLQTQQEPPHPNQVEGSQTKDSPTE
jgi:GAF domain-containing protein